MQVGEHWVVITRKRIKNLYLRVREPSQVEVSAPRHWPEKDIRALVAARSEWIKEKQQKLARRPQPKTLSYCSGELLPYAGDHYRLIITKARQHNRVELKAGELHLALTRADDAMACQAAIERWYRQQLKQRIADLLAQWQPIMRVQASDFGVRKMKTRWGSCNIRTQKIWLNLELVTKHPECLEYVVVHELTHLYERYHNARFYALMDQFLPDWRTRRERLNNCD